MAKDNFLSIRVVAIKLAGSEGWQLDETDLELREYEDLLAEAGHPIIEVREITTGAKIIREGQSNQAGSMTVFTAEYFGWGWDEDASCWRAPNEPFKPPRGNPKKVGNLEVSFSKPNFGWLPINIRAEDQQVYFSASYLFDPLPDIIKWLEALIREEYSRVHVDIEGIFYDLHLFEGREKNEVRFVVIADDYTEEEAEDNDSLSRVEMDVLINKYKLVESFYTAFLVLWPPKDFPFTFLRNWISYNDHEQDEKRLRKKALKLRSPEIEDYLLKLK